jgi:hypothetical protein
MITGVTTDHDEEAAMMGCSIRSVLVAGMMAALFGLVPAAPALARITCANGYQLVQGSYLATPYCQDALVADVAREFGIKASAAAIRNDPLFKRQVCRTIGRDIRVQEACIPVNPGVRGRGF